jgi:protein TonB
MTTIEPKNREDRQIHSDSLLPYLLVSLLIHGLVALIIALQQRSQPATKQQQQPDNAPIEFIVLPPEEVPDKPPETNRRAVNNSIAQGKVKSELPPTTEKKGETAIDSSPASTPEIAPSQSETKPSEAVKPTPPVASKPEPVQPPQPPTPTEPEPVKPPQPPTPITAEPEPVQPPQPPTPTEPEPVQPPQPPTPITAEPEPVQPPQPPTPTEPEPVQPPQPPTPTEPEPVQPPQPPTPTTSEPQAVARSSSVDSPTAKTPVEETPTNSSAASLLGETYQRSIKEDGGSSFFNSEALAQKEAPYAKLDAQQDDLAPYFEEIRRRVKRNWQPSSPGDDRSTVVAFAIERNGQITGLRIVETSGKERVDRDALEAIQKSAPFAPLPQSFNRDRLEVQFNFNIYIHQGSFSPNLAIPYP